MSLTNVVGSVAGGVERVDGGGQLRKAEIGELQYGLAHLLARVQQVLRFDVPVRYVEVVQVLDRASNVRHDLRRLCEL